MHNKAHSTELAIIISYPTSTNGILQVLIFKNNQGILLDLVDFALQE